MPQKPMTLQEVLKDPDYIGLPKEEKIKVLKAIQTTQPKDKGEPIDWNRIAFQTLGGMAGGAVVGGGSGGLGTLAGIGLGSSAAGQAYDAVQGVTGQAKPKTMGEAAMTATEDFFYDVVSPAGLRAGLYGAKKVGGKLVEKTMSKLFKPASYASYAKYGLKPTAAVVTKNKAMGQAEQALSDYMFSAKPFQELAEHNVEQLKFASGFLAKEYGDILSREEIGLLLKKGATKSLDRLRNVFDKLYTNVSKSIGSQPQSISNTDDMLRTLLKEAETGPSTGIASIADEIVEKAAKNNGGLSFDSLKNFRTYVGELMKDPALITTRNIKSGDLKKLYGALTRDMEVAAEKAGPQAHARWRAANKYFETALTQKVPILEDVIKKGYPEEVFDAVLKSSKKGGSRLRALRRQLSPEEWGAVAGTVFGKLGTALPGAQSEKLFSTAIFLTNWKDRLSSEAKRALWAGTKYHGLYKELDEFAHVVGDFEWVDKLANKSKTGSVLMFFSIFQTIGAGVGYAASGSGGAYTGMATAATLAGGPYVTAKLLTNQKFVKWLSQGVKIIKTNPNAIKLHMGRLFALTEKEDIKNEVQQLINGVTQQE